MIDTLTGNKSVILVAVTIHKADCDNEIEVEAEPMPYSNLKGVVYLRYLTEEGVFTDVSSLVAANHLADILKLELEQVKY